MPDLHRLVRPPMYAASRPPFKAAYARAARRYGFDVGKFPGFAKRNGVVVKNDLEYVVPVKIGTPGVTLYLDFDTGASDLWVWSSELANVSKHSGHTIYNPKNSSTAKHATGTWRISYGDASSASGDDSSASGDVYTDTVTVADIAIPAQAIELAKNLSSSFLTDGGNDGVLGLAWPQINTISPRLIATPVENMIDKNLIEQPLFTVKLGRGEEPGFYSFGYIDPHVTSDQLSYTSVNSGQGFWNVPSASFSLNGRKIARQDNTAILDTGTTLALVDDDILSQIYGAIEGAKYDEHQGGWKYPSKATVPTIAFAVGDQLYTVNAADFAYGEADEGYLFGGIQSRGDFTFDILGATFLKSVYVVFNQGESTVGIAQRHD